MTTEQKYPGEELTLFEKALNWKNYFSLHILPFIHGKVLETGAGIGGTTTLLNKNTADQWMLCEPDPALYEILHQKISEKKLPENCVARKGTLESLSAEERFDCIIYIDVLEHIENDKAELSKALSHLKTGGHLIVLSPAFPSLFSPFDKAIGHYRRYTRKTLTAAAPPGLIKEKFLYLDSAGFFASLINKWFLRQAYPSLQQVLFWDKWLVPASRITDRIFFYSFGKSILAVWKKK